MVCTNGHFACGTSNLFKNDSSPATVRCCQPATVRHGVDLGDVEGRYCLRPDVFTITCRVEFRKVNSRPRHVLLLPKSLPISQYRCKTNSYRTCVYFVGCWGSS